TALQSEFPPKAVKIGMLGKLNSLKKITSPIIFDPIISSTSGKILLIQDIMPYLPYVDVFTPNLPEAEMILQQKIHSPADVEKAAKQFLSLGVKSILIKGGHANHPSLSQDYWSNGQESFWLTSPRYEQKNYRGTGCVYASAIAANLALGCEIKDAIVIAKMYVNRGIRLTQSSFLVHGSWPEEEIDMPYLSDNYIEQIPASFPTCGTTPLGLYPIVNNSQWVEKLLSLGVTTIQLRIKDKLGEELEDEIKKSIQIAKQYQARLFINDYWELAIKHQAYGVHLGQEDLKIAEIEKIYQAGLRLGISTHCYYEVARAHTFRPSYLACGPIFPTTSKIMAFAPQGIDRLSRWQRTLNSYRWVAIGGINLKNIPAILKSGADGVALISAITQAKYPEKVTQQFLQLMGQC
ncbi:MAG: thiamine phosphate synthase, partial [Gammaproteobacteria bacterium]